MGEMENSYYKGSGRNYATEDTKKESLMKLIKIETHKSTTHIKLRVHST